MAQGTVPHGGVVTSHVRIMHASLFDIAEIAVMSAQTSQLRDTLRDVAEVALESTASQGLNEAETRAHLIDPILGALDYRSFDSVRRGVPIPGNKKELDYLLTAGDVRVVVEAKALRSTLGAPEAIQTVEYCAVLGVRWALLTNGLRWEIFDNETSGDWESRRVAAVEIDCGDEGKLAKANDGLSLFARDRLCVDEAGLVRWTRLERARVLLSRMLSDASSQMVQAITAALRDAGARIEPGEVVALIQAGSAMLQGVPEGSVTSETAGDAPVVPASCRNAPVNYYLLPAGNRSGFKAMDHLQQWLACGFWGLSKSAANRRRLERGDLCCFYSVSRGVVATAKIDGSADHEVTSTEWPGPNPFEPETYKVPLTDIEWLPEPRPIDQSVRERLEAFRAHDPARNWSWFVQTPKRLSKVDFEVLLGFA